MQRSVLVALLLLGAAVVLGSAQYSAAQPEPKQPAPKQPAAAGQEKEATPDQVAFFEKNIRPVFVEKCISCHSKADNKTRGSLALDTRAGLLKGGDTGPAIIPGKPEQSLLLRALKHTGDLKMPPSKNPDEEPVKLEAHIIANFEKWIKDGAADPRTGKVLARNLDIEKGKEHWAFRPISSPPVPTPKLADWAQADIDRFLLAAMEAKNLKPVEDATPRVLVRRLYFDLIGLPPTPEQVETFVAEAGKDRKKAIEKLVDELLASPHYGERLGRHWLDVARYAESSGKDQNVVYPFAWRYRDYVIASFNADKPYDQFLKEQIAGDLLPAKNDDQRAEMQIATGFLALGSKAVGTANPREFRMDVVDEQLDALSQGMLGLTIACARCHDHKFDPIPQKDYYALAGIFTSTDTRFGGSRSLQVRQISSLLELPKVDSVVDGNKRTAEEFTRLKTQLEDAKKALTTAQEEARNATTPLNGFLRVAFARAQVDTLTKQVGYYDAEGNSKKMAMGVLEGYAGDTRVLERGDVAKPGETVKRGFPQVLHTGKEPAITKGSGRLELASWVASADNPLTSRVIVNRVWLHLFGHGLVHTPDNFGFQGEAPTHPALLDHLAKAFVADGWSMKKFVKRLVLTRAYQMASTTNVAQQQVDPDNEWFWRQDKKRLEAEALRDALLAVSGKLDATPPVGSPLARSLDGLVRGPGGFGGPRPGGPFGAPAENRNRTVYQPIVRDNPGEFLSLFDFADSNSVTGQRSVTTVPTQALYLMNSPFVQSQADAFAARLSGENDEAKVKSAFHLAFGRDPRPTEIKAIEKLAAKYGQSKSEMWTVFCQALLASAEFRTID
jgi:cytochrome c553